MLGGNGGVNNGSNNQTTYPATTYPQTPQGGHVPPHWDFVAARKEFRLYASENKL